MQTGVCLGALTPYLTLPYLTKANSKNLDMIKINFKSHLKILHQLTTPSFQFMIESSQLDQNICDWCHLLYFFPQFGFLIIKRFLNDFFMEILNKKLVSFFHASHCTVTVSRTTKPTVTKTQTATTPTATITLPTTTHNTCNSIHNTNGNNN